MAAIRSAGPGVAETLLCAAEAAFLVEPAYPELPAKDRILLLEVQSTQVGRPAKPSTGASSRLCVTQRIASTRDGVNSKRERNGLMRALSRGVRIAGAI